MMAVLFFSLLSFFYVFYMFMLFLNFQLHSRQMCLSSSPLPDFSV